MDHSSIMTAPPASSSAEDEQKLLKQRLKALLARPENQKCCDCSDLRPTWASLIVPPPDDASQSSSPSPSSQNKSTVGAFCCLQCSGVHRSLGTHICFVRSINLDDWKEKEVVAMEFGGNRRLNSAFQAPGQGLLPDITPTVEQAIRNEFVKDKYLHRKFYSHQAFADLMNTPPEPAPVVVPVVVEPAASITTRPPRRDMMQRQASMPILSPGSTTNNLKIKNQNAAILNSFHASVSAVQPFEANWDDFSSGSKTPSKSRRSNSSRGARTKDELSISWHPTPSNNQSSLMTLSQPSARQRKNNKNKSCGKDDLSVSWHPESPEKSLFLLREEKSIINSGAAATMTYSNFNDSATSFDDDTAGISEATASTTATSTASTTTASTATTSTSKRSSRSSTSRSSSRSRTTSNSNRSRSRSGSHSRRRRLHTSRGKSTAASTDDSAALGDSAVSFDIYDLRQEQGPTSTTTGSNSVSNSLASGSYNNNNNNTGADEPALVKSKSRYRKGMRRMPSRKPRQAVLHRAKSVANLNLNGAEYGEEVEEGNCGAGCLHSSVPDLLLDDDLVDSDKNSDELLPKTKATTGTISLSVSLHNPGSSAASRRTICRQLSDERGSNSSDLKRRTLQRCKSGDIPQRRQEGTAAEAGNRSRSSERRRRRRFPVIDDKGGDNKEDGNLEPVELDREESQGSQSRGEAPSVGTTESTNTGKSSRSRSNIRRRRRRASGDEGAEDPTAPTELDRADSQGTEVLHDATGNKTSRSPSRARSTERRRRRREKTVTDGAVEAVPLEFKRKDSRGSQNANGEDVEEDEEMLSEGGSKSQSRSRSVNGRRGGSRKAGRARSSDASAKARRRRTTAALLERSMGVAVLLTQQDDEALVLQDDDLDSAHYTDVVKLPTDVRKSLDNKCTTDFPEFDFGDEDLFPDPDRPTPGHRMSVF